LREKREREKEEEKQGVANVKLQISLTEIGTGYENIGRRHQPSRKSLSLSLSLSRFAKPQLVFHNVAIYYLCKKKSDLLLRGREHRELEQGAAAAV